MPLHPLIQAQNMGTYELPETNNTRYLDSIHELPETNNTRYLDSIHELPETNNTRYLDRMSYLKQITLVI